MLIINFKSSIQRELDNFFKAISRSDFKIREVTKGAFTQARAKLNPWAFQRLNEVAANTFYEEAEYYVWHNMRVLATDGTRLVLPNHPGVIEEFDKLYHYRWNEEEAYKLLKSRIELENFSGKTARAVKQDFHAKVFLMTLCAAYAHPIEDKVVEEYKADENRKFDQKINRTNAISMTQDILIAVFLRKQFDKALNAFDKVVAGTREIIRPGRSNPRKKKTKTTLLNELQTIMKYH